MRSIRIGHKNWLFADSAIGGETLAQAMTLIEAAKVKGPVPHTWLVGILDRIHDHNISRGDGLLPWNRTPLR